MRRENSWIAGYSKEHHGPTQEPDIRKSIAGESDNALLSDGNLTDVVCEMEV